MYAKNERFDAIKYNLNDNVYIGILQTLLNGTRSNYTRKIAVARRLKAPDPKLKRVVDVYKHKLYTYVLSEASPTEFVLQPVDVCRFLRVVRRVRDLFDVSIRF